MKGVQDQDVRERPKDSTFYILMFTSSSEQQKPKDLPSLPSYNPSRSIRYHSQFKPNRASPHHSFNPVPPARLLPPPAAPPTRLPSPPPHRRRRRRPPTPALLPPRQIPRHLNRLAHNPRRPSPARHLPSSGDEPLHVTRELYPEAREESRQGAAGDERDEDQGEDLEGGAPRVAGEGAEEVLELLPGAGEEVLAGRAAVV